MSNHRVATLNAKAHALSAFRILPNGKGRQYTATTFPKDPWRGCSLVVRQAAAVGWLADGGARYAVLDTIPTAEAFRRLKQKLKLAVECEENDGY